MPKDQQSVLRPEGVGVHGSHIYYDNVERPSHFQIWVACQPAPHDVLGINLESLDLSLGLAVSEWNNKRYAIPKLFR